MGTNYGRTLGRRDPRLAPTEKATRDDIVWAAGIFEGEGSSYLGRRSSAIVCVPQKDRWLPDRLRALFGGNVYKEKKRIQFHWQACGARARGFLMSIYGLLSPRRQEQVRKALLK